MGSWTTTKNAIVQQIGVLAKREMGVTRVGYVEQSIISDAVNMAFIDFLLDYGIDRWKFIKTEGTLTTTADTSYVDLPINVFRVLKGSVRIDNDTLYPMELEDILQIDPDQSVRSQPTNYEVDSSGTQNTNRLVLWPIPDAAYTIKYTAELLVDSDELAAFPTWMYPCLIDKAKDNALRDLGFPNAALAFERSYNSRLKKSRDVNRTQGPQYVRRVTSGFRGPGIQSRIQ